MANPDQVLPCLQQGPGTETGPNFGLYSVMVLEQDLPPIMELPLFSYSSGCGGTIPGRRRFALIARPASFLGSPISSRRAQNRSRLQVMVPSMLLRTEYRPKVAFRYNMVSQQATICSSGSHSMTRR